MGDDCGVVGEGVEETWWPWFSSGSVNVAADRAKMTAKIRTTQRKKELDIILIFSFDGLLHFILHWKHFYF